jgi:hypothetical protein
MIKQQHVCDSYPSIQCGAPKNDGEIGEHNSNFTMVGDILSDTYNLKVS